MSRSEASKARRKEYFKKRRSNPLNKEKRNSNNRQRYANDSEYREKLKIATKKYVLKNYSKIIESNRVYRKKRRLEDSKYREQINAIHKKYMQEHLGAKKNLNAYMKPYRKTDTGIESLKKCKSKRSRNLGYNPLNKLFEGCAGHHIDKVNIINIPNELHKSIGHRQSSNNQMKLINIAAWNFMESQTY